MLENPLISIVVLNWNGEKIFPACLEALQKTGYAPIEILFVDNGSSDRSVELARDFTGVKIIENGRNLGYAAGNNRAVRFLSDRSKYVCFLNNDVVVTPGWLDEAVAYLEKRPEVGVVACRNMSYPNTTVVDGLYHCIQRFFSIARFGRGLPFCEDPLFSKPGYVLSALGASAIYRTELFSRLGGFDESFYAYYEDTDLCMRINNCGYRCLYVPAAIVYHHDQASFGKDSLSSKYYSFRNEWIFFKKNFPPRFLVNHLPGLVLENARTLKSCLAGDTNLKVFLRARSDALSLLGRYKLRDRRSFNARFIEDLIARKKIPL